MAARFFKEHEYSCKCGCGKSDLNSKLLSMLDELRVKCGRPLVINSGCRCEEHNRKSNGSPTSSHVLGLAVDIKAETSKEKYDIVYNALILGFRRIGIYSKFIHLDIDNNKVNPVIFYGGY